MEYTGLLQRFPVDRPLTGEERELRLSQKRRLDLTPLAQLSVIRLNSTYLEMTDKFYEGKGVLATITLPIGLAFSATVGFMLYQLYLGAWREQHNPSWVGIALVAMLAPFLAFLAWLFCKEAFRYTHYPIRMNRRTGQVHVFRLDGTVLTASWDKLFFAICRCAQFGYWDIRGHVLDTDGVTVLETFALTDVGIGKPGQGELRGYWEFVRRYMEEGPGAVVGHVPFCMPIADKRESLRVGFERMFAIGAGQSAPVMLLSAAMAALFLPGRWLAMRTSRIPVWPEAVEAACPVDVDDPFVRDGSMNPPDLR